MAGRLAGKPRGFKLRRLHPSPRRTGAIRFARQLESDVVQVEEVRIAVDQDLEVGEAVPVYISVEGDVDVAVGIHYGGRPKLAGCTGRR